MPITHGPSPSSSFFFFCSHKLPSSVFPLLIEKEGENGVSQLLVGGVSGRIHRQAHLQSYFWPEDRRQEGRSYLERVQRW